MARSLIVFFILVATACTAGVCFGQKPAPADKPAARQDDPVWVAKHQELLEKAKRGGIDLYFEGDSITRRWEATHRENWDRNFAGWRAGNFGAGGDRTQNVLFRIQ